MPILNISDGKGLLRTSVIKTLASVALYPHEEAKRVSLEHLIQAESLIHQKELWLSRVPEKVSDEDKGELLEILASLMDLRIPPYMALDHAFNRLPMARATGFTLLLLIELRTMIGRVSIEEAIQFASAGLEGQEPGPLVPTGTSVSSLTKGWAQFRSATHLNLAIAWAEFIEGIDLLARHPADDPESARMLLYALALSECLREYGEFHEILKPEETWKVPEDLELPEVDLGWEISPDGNTASILVCDGEGSTLSVLQSRTRTSDPPVHGQPEPGP